ncbi:collagen alpha-1(I) chain-like [Vulpes lagopus]|uniref:collagen alpha-1(I) chain-like n=1 Tax=Vulpes lagopus TaxID=494514 RepID=UPI001BCA4BA4|nr:collagen alpha-1(I) chain-like [Vulpes lagopus]
MAPPPGAEPREALGWGSPGLSRPGRAAPGAWVGGAFLGQQGPEASGILVAAWMQGGTPGATGSGRPGSTTVAGRSPSRRAHPPTRSTRPLQAQARLPGDEDKLSSASVVGKQASPKCISEATEHSPGVQGGPTRPTEREKAPEGSSAQKAPPRPETRRAGKDPGVRHRPGLGLFACSPHTCPAVTARLPAQATPRTRWPPPHKLGRAAELGVSRPWLGFVPGHRTEEPPGCGECPHQPLQALGRDSSGAKPGDAWPGRWPGHPLPPLTSGPWRPPHGCSTTKTGPRGHAGRGQHHHRGGTRREGGLALQGRVRVGPDEEPEDRPPAAPGHQQIKGNRPAADKRRVRRPRREPATAGRPCRPAGDPFPLPEPGGHLAGPQLHLAATRSLGGVKLLSHEAIGLSSRSGVHVRPGVQHTSLGPPRRPRGVLPGSQAPLPCGNQNPRCRQQRRAGAVGARPGGRYKVGGPGPLPPPSARPSSELRQSPRPLRSEVRQLSAEADDSAETTTRPDGVAHPAAPAGTPRAQERGSTCSLTPRPGKLRPHRGQGPAVAEPPASVTTVSQATLGQVGTRAQACPLSRTQDLMGAGPFRHHEAATRCYGRRPRSPQQGWGRDSIPDSIHLLSNTLGASPGKVTRRAWASAFPQGSSGPRPQACGPSIPAPPLAAESGRGSVFLGSGPALGTSGGSAACVNRVPPSPPRGPGAPRPQAPSRAGCKRAAGSLRCPGHVGDSDPPGEAPPRVAAVPGAAGLVPSPRPCPVTAR